MDNIADDFGIALGLGEEIAIDERAGEMSQELDSVLGPPVRETSLIPISHFNRRGDTIDLTDFNNWVVSLTKRLRSPFVEKWKLVAMGKKNPEAPLLTYSEEQAFLLAQEIVTIDNKLDEESKKTSMKIKELKELRTKLEMIAAGKEIMRRRYSHGKNRNNGKEGI